MDDSSEHDEKFEDAEDSGDDEQLEQPKKTRKAASGRVIIKSKEGESYPLPPLPVRGGDSEAPGGGGGARCGVAGGRRGRHGRHVDVMKRCAAPG